MAIFQHRVAALTLAIGLAATAFVIAQPQAGDSPRTGTLTPRDRIEIRQLVSRYAYALDSGAGNGYAYADLFAPDGEFVGTSGVTRGREALAALGRLGFVEGRKPANGVGHFIMNHVIEPAAGGATGKQYMVLVQIGENGMPGGDFSNVGGHYEDVYVHTAAGWRFKRRAFIPNRNATPGRE